MKNCIVGKLCGRDEKKKKKFVFIRKNITSKIFAFDSDIDLVIGSTFIRVKFVEIIENR